jgi:hypothetical protein
MRRVAVLLVIILAVAVISACLFLAYGNFPVPSTPVEKVLPDARFPK